MIRIFRYKERETCRSAARATASIYLGNAVPKLAVPLAVPRFVKSNLVVRNARSVRRSGVRIQRGITRRPRSQKKNAPKISGARLNTETARRSDRAVFVFRGDGKKRRYLSRIISRKHSPRRGPLQLSSNSEAGVKRSIRLYPFPTVISSENQIFFSKESS